MYKAVIILASAHFLRAPQLRAAEGRRRRRAGAHLVAGSVQGVRARPSSSRPRTAGTRPDRAETPVLDAAEQSLHAGLDMLYGLIGFAGTGPSIARCPGWP